ncbi:hypothetical protein VSS74_14435 [Conexibacter stalactiti]|uniref:DUF1990 domain-containing protein n=1 Tax=Conexibacter stalactiti TaxID=1940611 RepID=A0ABU4HS25_9ACTN|nr:hypothetical protein [Conexibacter stalactiti]MDW5595544.1 hypothetical protein [Conexibacter stalactiti]MEC5036186.1 hypothetical protein [Conexibacter stalactiti]
MTAPLLLDELIPHADAVRTEHLLIDGDLAQVYDAVRAADFMRTAEQQPVRALFQLRALGERVVSTVRRRPLPAPAPTATMRLADLGAHGEWVVLGERPPHEIAIGVVGRFWAGETSWETIDARDFAGFERPGLAKIAAGFSLRPYGAGRVLVSYECRTLATDPQSRRAFLRYWRALSPFIGVVLRTQLRIVARTAAERAAR